MLLYRLLITLAAPFVAASFALRRLRGQESDEDLRQRRALSAPGSGSGAGPGAGRGPGRPLWLHGASNGELAAARPLIEALLADPELPLLVTTNTLTARTMVEGWQHPRITARLAPFDSRPVLRRFLATHDPRALLTVENELWPNRLVLMEARGLPTAVVAARLSESSARRWARLPGLAQQLLASLTLLSAQDSESAARFAVLGLPPEASAPPLALKPMAAPAPPDPQTLAALAPAFSRPDTILAASTHEGEEAQVLEAFVAARLLRPALRLILAPRHPHRSGEVAALIAATGLGFATRSAGEAPGETPIYLADTMGEMSLWYSLAGICFTGGSLVDKGGHTPWEPLHFGCALLHGPSCHNQRAAFAALDAAGAALPVSDATALADAFVALTPAPQAELVRAARKVAAAQLPDLAPLLSRLRGALGLSL